MQWIAGAFLALFVLVLTGLILVVAFLAFYNIPSNGAGMAAKAVCSAAFVAGRGTDADQLMEQDVLPASPAFAAVSVSIDASAHTATGSFLGVVHRTAALLPERGCVLDAEPDPAAQPYAPTTAGASPWPAGDAPVAPDAWGAGVDAAGLQATVDAAFEGAGDPARANARGVAVVQGGRLLVLREAPGFGSGVALHGWSAAKTVAAMLADARFAEVGLDTSTPVVDAFRPGREPEWVAQWREDDRSRITVADLLAMRAGLDIDEGYQPWDPVVQMLNGEADMSGWAAGHGLQEQPGTSWEYLSAVSNILAAVVRGQFATDQEYWAYPQRALLGPIGARSATLETDTSGTWVGSSYLWASTADWARLGEVMLRDGRWGGAQVLAPGWLERAAARALPQGEGAGYGAQTWIPADPVGGECRTTPGLPQDTLAMEGHWGQIVAMVPSRDAVIVRLGWTFEGTDQFDGCRFAADVLASLP